MQESKFVEKGCIITTYPVRHEPLLQISCPAKFCSGLLVQQNKFCAGLRFLQRFLHAD